MLASGAGAIGGSQAAGVFLAGAPRSGRLRLPRSERGQRALGAEPEPTCFQAAKSVGQQSVRRGHFCAT